jgi:hypothetical protein
MRDRAVASCCRRRARHRPPILDTSIPLDANGSVNGTNQQVSFRETSLLNAISVPKILNGWQRNKVEFKGLPKLVER